MRRLVALSLVAWTGCLLHNPAYGDGDGATGSASESGAATGASTGDAPPTTGAASTDGSAGSASASGTGDPTTGAATATTGEVSSGTGSTGQVDTGSSTGAPPPLVSCPGQEVVLTLAKEGGFPTRDTFVVTTADANCQWKNSDGNVLNPSYPCAQQNYGAPGAKYTVIGQENGGHAEYLVLFGLVAAIEAAGYDPEEFLVASAKLRIVTWWSMDRGPLSFRVGVIADADDWVEGTKGPDLAAAGDSSWEYRWIEGQNVKHGWSNPKGPAAASTQVTTVEVPALTANSHDYVESGEIAGAYLQPWVDDPAAERGFVITTDDAPILVKSKDTGYDPELVLTLCPL